MNLDHSRRAHDERSEKGVDKFWNWEHAEIIYFGGQIVYFGGKSVHFGRKIVHLDLCKNILRLG